MPAPTPKRIIALLSGLTIAALLIRLISLDNASNESADVDNFEFPIVRAHVYYASPDRCVQAFGPSAASLNVKVEMLTQHKLTIEFDDGIKVIAACLALGERHTRLAITVDSPHADIGNSALDHIAALQSEMDKRLTGG